MPFSIPRDEKSTAHKTHKNAPLGTQPYDIYYKLEFKFPVDTNIDCYDCYLIFVFEIKESFLIEQCLNSIQTQ